MLEEFGVCNIGRFERSKVSLTLGNMELRGFEIEVESEVNFGNVVSEDFEVKAES